MRVRLLGRPAITGPDGPVELRGPRQAGLLALLGAGVGRVVRTSRIEDELWDGQRVSESAVRVNINRLRARFVTLGGVDPIVSHTLGYSLDLPMEEVDSHSFAVDARAAAARRAAGHPRDALARADAAERWWRGPAFEGVAELPSVRPEHDRLESLRCDLWYERSCALVELGSIDEALEQIERLIAATPYRESAWGLRLYVLGRLGRRDEAITRYRELVELLDVELSMRPDSNVEAIAAAIRAGETDPPVARRLLGTRPDPGRPTPVDAATGRARAPGSDGPFVGRRAVVDRLRTFALDHLEASPAIAIVEGPPGIGKTRLGAAIADQVLAAGGTALVGACPRAGGTGIAAVADIMAGALTSLAPGPDHALDALASLVPAAFPSAAPAPDPDPEIRRLQLFDAASQAIARIPTRPVLIVVDDLHWVSADTAGFLRHLVDRTDARWLLLARSGERTPAAVELLADLGRCQPVRHTLEPLLAADVAALVQEVAPGDGGTWQQAVVERAGGNPFFVTELVRHLAAGGDATDVPAGVEQLMHASLGRLGPDAQRVAQVLAIARTPLPHAVLPVAADLDAEAVDTALDELAGAGLSHGLGSSGSAQLAHDLVIETIDGALGPGRRRGLHTAIGRALSDGPTGHGPAALAHLLQGGPEVSTAELDRVAADALHHLNAGAAFHESIRVGTAYLDGATADHPTRAGLDARVQLAAALLTAGSYGRGVSLLDRIEPDIRRQGDATLSADAILARGTINVAHPDLTVLVDQARLVLDALDRAQAARRVQLACWIAHHLGLIGRSAEALDLLDHAERENRFDPDPALQGMVLGVRMQVATGVETTPAEARAVYAELAAFTDRSPSVTSESWHRLFALDQAVRDGTLADHGAAIEALADILERFPRPELQWSVRAARAGHALARGQLDQAEALIVAAQVAGGELSVGSAAALWTMQLFMLQYERGAISVMTPFLSALTESSSSYQFAARALLYAEAGDLARARDMAARLAARDSILADAGVGWSALASQVGDIAFVAGEVRLAENVIGELTPHAGTALSAAGLMHLGAADRTLGLAWATLGELDRAIDQLDQAHADDRRRGADRWAGRAARSAAALRRRRRRRGDLNAARVLDQEAGRLLADGSTV